MFSLPKEIWATFSGVLCVLCGQRVLYCIKYDLSFCVLCVQYVLCDL